MIINSVKPYNFQKNLRSKKVSFGSAQSKPDTFEKTEKKEKVSLFRRLFPKKPKKKAIIQEGQFLAHEGRYIFNRHTTCFFRSDLDWGEFGDLLKEKYSNSKKVNTYIWGCSYGDEAYSLSMLLSKLFGKDCEKFYPIIARDINPNVIEIAKKEQNNGVEIGELSKNSIVSRMGLEEGEEEAFIEPTGEESGKLKEDTLKTVQFEHGNIVVDTASMDSDNPSIVFCRNMWPYINPAKYASCAQKLYDTLAKGSMVVIGGYDHFGEIGCFGSKNFPKELIKAGFKPLYDYAIGGRESFYEDELEKYALIYVKD